MFNFRQMKKMIFIPILLTFLAGCGQTDSTVRNETKKAVLPGVKDPYPFKTLPPADGRYTIVAETEGEALFPKYVQFFEKHGYTGNGYTWEGHIVQILEKEDPGLLQHLEFDPEAGAFYVYVDSEASQQQFINRLSPIFADLSSLEKYVKAADRNRIDD